MALNPDFVGRVYPPSATYVVGREKVREFASAIGDPNPAYHDVEAAQRLGYADLLAPPTFAIILSMRALSDVIHDPELGLDFSRVVHGDQRFAFERAIIAGDELQVTTTIESIRFAAGNDMITTRADVATLDGQHVASTHALLISRGPEGDAP